MAGACSSRSSPQHLYSCFLLCRCGCLRRPSIGNRGCLLAHLALAQTSAESTLRALRAPLLGLLRASSCGVQGPREDTAISCFSQVVCHPAGASTAVRKSASPDTVSRSSGFTGWSTGPSAALYLPASGGPTTASVRATLCCSSEGVVCSFATRGRSCWHAGWKDGRCASRRGVPRKRSWQTRARTARRTESGRRCWEGPGQVAPHARWFPSGTRGLECASHRGLCAAGRSAVHITRYSRRTREGAKRDASRDAMRDTRWVASWAGPWFSAPGCCMPGGLSSGAAFGPSRHAASSGTRRHPTRDASADTFALEHRA